MVYIEKLLNIIALMKCEDDHTKKLIDSSHSTDSYFPLVYRSAILMVKNQ